jgi:hypothetical protein
VGDTGGAYQTWTTNAPANTDVTITVNHWPCNTGSSVGVNVWGPTGKLASSWAKDACTQEAKYNTGAGGATEVQLYNYNHGVGTWWSLMAEGLAIGGPAAPAAPAAAAADTASTTMDSATTTAATTSTTTMAATDMAATTTATTTTAAPAAPAGAGTLSVGGSVFGNGGGAYVDHNLTVEEGKKYHVTMTVSPDAGGKWNGVGFNVWGPSGHIAMGSYTSSNTIEADFTADGNVVYLIQPYNYHHGLNVWYALEAMPAD